MIIIISILIFIILLYLCLEFIYKRYKEDLNDLEKQNIYMQKKISEMGRKEMINEKLIKWLYDELTRKNLLSIEKENKDEKK